MTKLLPYMLRGLSVWLLLMAMVAPAVAQNYSGHNWYFGNSPNAIRFNRATNAPILLTNKAIPFGVGGSAVATDPIDSDLLFYTDGSNIYDVTNKVMPSGAGLGANTAGNQPVAIAKAPGPNQQYYVFVNTASFTTGGSISYRLVDMSLFGNAAFPTPAIGDATAATNTNIGALTGTSEAMITVPHKNGEDFWLIAHANGSPDYFVTPFTATGPGTTTAFTGLGLIEVAANFSYHPSTGRIAVSPQETTRDIEIINFDNATGVLSFNQRILNTGATTATNQSIYDTEWSNNGQYLYISRFGEPGVQADVLQYDLLNPFSTMTSVLPQPVFRSYGLQMAPDSLIYHLYQLNSATDPFLLGTLANTDTVASEVTYTSNAFTGNPDFIGTQFPSFAPKDTIGLKVTFTSSGTCSNAPTSFFPTVTPAADSLIWDFGDGTGSAKDWSPVYTYTQGGTFNVKVKAFLRGDTASYTAPITITQFDLKLSLVQDTTACLCEYKPPVGTACKGTPFHVQVKAQGGTGTPQYQWFGPPGILASQTTDTLTPDSAGYYYVVATIGSCSTYAGVNIKTYDSLDQRANIWHFGTHAGIDFNGLPNKPAVAITGPLDTPEGCAVICDRNGQVIISTDGQHLFDRQKNDITPAPVPPGLGGENGSTQSSLIIPVPGDETLYYIFTTQQVYGSYTYELRYSLFDLKLNNGQGALSQWNQLLFTKSTERITGNQQWLIAHEYGNNTFRAYKITQQGIGNPVISSIGSDHAITSEENGQGYMELGTGSKLAVALSTPGVSNVVEIFDFVDSTGMVTNFRSADLKSTTGQVYGIEISQGGNKLFATLKDASSKMYEFAFDSLGMPHLKQAVNQTGELGAIQTGPDGQIYVAINGSTSLGTFQANEDTTKLSGITTLQPFALAAGTQSNLGLPNFTQIISNPSQSPTMDVTNLCLGDSTTFTASGKDSNIDKFWWTFGDGQSNQDGGPEIKHVYQNPGTYHVHLVIYNKCEDLPNGYATFDRDIVIRPRPADPSLGVPICSNTVTLDANPGSAPGLHYAWTRGDTTRVIKVNVPGQYPVTVTDNAGCSTDGKFLVVDNRPKTELGPDLTLCQNAPVAPLDAFNPGATFAWTINGAASGATQTQAVNTASTGKYEYKVVVTDPVTSCFVRDSITYTINASPVFTATPTDPTTCGANNGKIDVTITAPTGTLFTYFITGTSGTFSNTDQPLTTVSTPSTLAAGTYGITVTDQVSGCTTINTANINDPAFTVSGVPNASCDPIGINVTLSVAQTNPTYRIIDNATNAVAETGSVTGATTTFSSKAAGLPSNNKQYVVEVKAAGCTASSPPVTVKQASTVPTTLTANPCANPISITAGASGAGVTYAWAGPNITAGATAQTVQATPPQGPNTYTLHVTQTGFCPLDTAITVNVSNTIAPDFTQSDACSNKVTLSATPTGPYTYRWYRNNSLVSGGGGQQIIIGLADNGQQYRVEVVNAVSGCVVPSATKTVNVAGDLQVTLASTIPCEGSPFTLTAGTNQTTGVTFSWTYNGAAIAGQTSPSFQETRAGLYVVTASLPGCSKSKEFNIVLSPVTPGTLTDTGVICTDPANTDPTTREKILDAGPDFISYTWYKEQVDVNTHTQTYTATEIGNYSVDLVNAFGCTSSDHTTITEQCDPVITGPNAFRPTSNLQVGGEYANREFKLFTFFISDDDFQVFIFNRWGEMIYQSPEREFRWNGGFNNNAGQPAPPGTYTYVVRYKSSYRPEEGIQEKRGGVVLLR